MKHCMFFFILKFVKRPGLNTLVGWFWPTSRMFTNPGVDAQRQDFDRQLFVWSKTPEKVKKKSNLLTRGPKILREMT